MNWAAVGRLALVIVIIAVALFVFAYFEHELRILERVFTNPVSFLLAIEGVVVGFVVLACSVVEFKEVVEWLFRLMGSKQQHYPAVSFLTRILITVGVCFASLAAGLVIAVRLKA